MRESTVIDTVDAANYLAFQDKCLSLSEYLFPWQYQYSISQLGVLQLSLN